MLQSGTQVSEMVPASDFFVAYGSASLGFAHPLLKAQRDYGFGTLDPEMGKNDVEKPSCDDGASYPRVGVSCAPLARVSRSTANQATTGDTAAESLLEFNEKRRIAIRDFHLKPELGSFGGSAPASPRSDDGYATVRIENPGEVLDIVHQNGLSARNGMVVNSGELRCPARKGAEGQSRAKQSAGVPMGVCNEHVPPAKAKMCSALMGNHEKPAEMTGSVDIQASYGAATVKSMRNIKGDRQCPPGRAYALRTDDIHFMVDPRFLFKWTGDLTYPDQMAFTRLCGLRFFMKTQRRMFSAVYDGVTA